MLLPSPQDTQQLLLAGGEESLLRLSASLGEIAAALCTATSCEQVCAQLQDGDFAAALLTVGDAQLDAFAAARSIRDSARGRKLPILFLVEQTPTAEMLQRGREIGEADWLPAALGEAVLRTRVQWLLQQARAEAQLQARSRQLAAVLEHLPDGVLLVDAQEQVLLSNPSLERLSGAAGREPAGARRPLGLLPGVFAAGTPSEPARQWVIPRALRGESVDISDLILRSPQRPEGGFFAVLGRPIRDAEDRILGALAVLRDETQHRCLLTELQLRHAALRESESLYRTMVERGPAVTYVCRPDAGFSATYISANLQKLLGYEPQEFTGTAELWMHNLHPEDAPRVLAELARLGEREQWVCEYRLRHKDGSYRWVYDAVSLLRDELARPLKRVGFWLDITERKQAEQEIARLNQDLRRQAQELELSRRRAEQESHYKSKFLAGMSHELRTPLNSIIGFSELLEQELFGPLTQRQKDYVNNVLYGGRYLLKLINDILDLSKIDAGHMELRREWTAAASLLDAVQSVAQPLADKRGVALEVSIAPDLPELFLDPLRIKQVLYNLLSNAIKFTPRGGLVKLSLRGDEECLRIEVADTGVGIAPENLQLLSREFSRFTHSPQVESEGTGLGLSLTRRLVAMHGGDISVVSEPGRGSTFTAALPLIGRRARRARTITGLDLSRVLLAESDAALRDGLVARLRSLGLSVTVVGTAAEAVRLARELRPGALLLDIRLPDADGWSVISQLQRDPLVSAAAVIVLSVLEPPERSEQLGVSCYLTKPTSPTSIQMALLRVGVRVCLVVGLRVLLLGSERPHLLAIAEHLRAAGCAVQQAESLAAAGGPAAFDLAIVDQSIADGTEVAPPPLRAELGRLPALLLCDPPEGGHPLPSEGGPPRLLVADALDISQLVRAVAALMKAQSAAGGGPGP